MITAPVLRLDRDPDRTRLLETSQAATAHGCSFWIPLVRLHGIDENNAGEVAELLAYFRSLQRQLDLSVVLVHHTRKNAAGGVAAGQGLRGSSDIHAFGDSNLYLRRTREHLVLSERAPGGAGIGAGLSGTGRDRRGDDPPGGHRGARRTDKHGRGLEERVLDLLAGGAVPDAGEAPRFAGGQERASGRGAGVARASRPALPHARWLATPGLIARSRSP